jgi:hypothetical protein
MVFFWYDWLAFKAGREMMECGRPGVDIEYIRENK